MKIEYPYIRAWGILLGSHEYYIKGQIWQAKEDKAPEDAIYFDSKGQWKRFTDITSDYTRNQVESTVNKWREEEKV